MRLVCETDALFCVTSSRSTGVVGAQDTRALRGVSHKACVEHPWVPVVAKPRSLQVADTRGIGLDAMLPWALVEKTAVSVALQAAGVHGAVAGETDTAVDTEIPWARAGSVPPEALQVDGIVCEAL